MVSRADKGLLPSQRHRDDICRVDIQVHTRRQTQRRLSIQALPSSAKTSETTYRCRGQEHPRQGVDKGKTAGGREKRSVRTLRDGSHTKRKRLYSHYHRTQDQIPDYGETHTRKERRGGRKNGHQTAEALKKHVKSITTDNGGEFAKHKLISKKLHTSVYFTDPYSSWQKGTVENTNKLIRQYIPKTMNINQLSYNKLLGIQYLLNQRPRKSLLFKSPFALFYNFAC